MTALIFIIVLVVLIVVHELGHFIVAKLSGMRVDEFGLGYPPRLAKYRFRETDYTLNALPFGGFVRIYGEDEPELTTEQSGRAFASRPKILQAATLLAGIAMNLLLAYVVLSTTLLMGTPRALAPEEIGTATEVELVIISVLQDSPAALAGLTPGDAITSVSGNGSTFASTSAEAFSAYVESDASTAPLTFEINRNGKMLTQEVTPKTGLVPAKPELPVVGVTVAPVGIIPVSLLQAPIEGAKLTWAITKGTAIGLAQFFGSIFTLNANLGDVSGPVGIAGAVGSAAHQGLSQLLSITAIISINLALINLLPIPALDGGRLLFVIIEAITRKPIKSSVAMVLNSVSFILLLILMLVVTGHDILKLL